MRRTCALVVCLLALSIPTPSEAGGFELRLGGYFPRADTGAANDLFRDLGGTLDVGAGGCPEVDQCGLFGVRGSDWNAFTGGIEFSAELGSFFEAGIRVDGSSRTLQTSYVDFVDALLQVAEREHTIEDESLRRVIEDTSSRLVLLTAHRRESFGEPLREIFRAIRSLADEVEDVHIVYPVHPNPAVLGPARELLSGHPRIHLTDPLSYLDLVAALRAASLVLTDSGGIQEEAPTFGAPVLVLRNVTERPEGIEAGVAELVGTDAERIIDRSLKALSGPAREDRRNPYGDGGAGARIADIVLADLTGRPRTTEDWTA